MNKILALTTILMKIKFIMIELSITLSSFSDVYLGRYVSDTDEFKTIFE